MEVTIDLISKIIYTIVCPRDIVEHFVLKPPKDALAG